MWCGGLDNSSSTIPAARCLLSWQCPCCWLNAWNWCRCRFPHVDVYLCKFNFHTKRSMRVCTGVCVGVCVCANTMKIHFTLPGCLGFYLLFVVVATVVWQKYFFLYCFLSDLISEWMLHPLPHPLLSSFFFLLAFSAALSGSLCFCVAEILLWCGLKIVCLLIENAFFRVLHLHSLAKGAMSLINWQHDGKRGKGGGAAKLLATCAHAHKLISNFSHFALAFISISFFAFYFLHFPTLL